jgi:hypothetical protein
MGGFHPGREYTSFAFRRKLQTVDQDVDTAWQEEAFAVCMKFNQEGRDWHREGVRRKGRNAAGYVEVHKPAKPQRLMLIRLRYYWHG